MNKQVDELLALALTLKDPCCDTETTMQKLKASLEAALTPVMPDDSDMNQVHDGNARVSDETSNANSPEELMALALDLRSASNEQALAKASALKAALANLAGPLELVGWRYKYKNCFGNIYWSFELPRSPSTKVLERVPVYVYAKPTQTPVE